MISLKQKHPPHPEPSFYPNDEVETEQIIPTEDEVRLSIVTFKKGPAGGFDNLKPQILKDVLYIKNGEAGSRVLIAVTSLVKTILKGGVPKSICQYLYGASLTALQKKCGVIRPIAVGNIWRIISAKIACRRVSSVLSNLFLPLQLGVGIKNGAEAGAHAARLYYNFIHKSIRIFLKIDIRNAFNELRRDVLLHEVKDKIPDIYKFVEQCYRYPSNVYYQKGVQQGDPLGPALFCLVIHDIISNLQILDLNIWYMDDGTIAGNPEDVLRAFKSIIEKAKAVGLDVNFNKCEMAILGTEMNDVKLEWQRRFNSVSDGIQIMKAESRVYPQY